LVDFLNIDAAFFAAGLRLNFMTRFDFVTSLVCRPVVGGESCDVAAVRRGGAFVVPIVRRRRSGELPRSSCSELDEEKDESSELSFVSAIEGGNLVGDRMGERGRLTS